MPEQKHFAPPADGKWQVHDRMPGDWPALVQRLLRAPGPAAFGGAQPNRWFIHFREGPAEDRSATYVWFGHLDTGYAAREGGPAKAP